MVKSKSLNFQTLILPTNRNRNSMLDNFSLFSKGSQYFSYRWVIFLYSPKALMSICICWVCCLYSQKALSISHILLGNFSIFSKGAQYFSYRCVIFLYSQKALMSISHIFYRIRDSIVTSISIGRYF